MLGPAFLARAVDWMKEGAHPYNPVLMLAVGGLRGLVALEADRVLSRADYRSMVFEVGAGNAKHSEGAMLYVLE